MAKTGYTYIAACFRVLRTVVPYPCVVLGFSGPETLKARSYSVAAQKGVHT